MPKPMTRTLQCLRGNAGSDGEMEVVERFSDKWVHFTGNFNGATLQLQGSSDGSTWTTLSAADATSACFRSVPESVRFLRVHTSVQGGSSFAVTAHLQCFDQTALV